MDNITFQQKFNLAWENKKKGSFSEAMEIYDELYTQLIKEAGDYARSFEGSTVDEGDTRKIMPLFFNKSEEYLKRDNVACTILNNMGVIMAEVGNKDSAKKYFEESIKFTPDDLDYQNPIIGL